MAPRGGFSRGGGTRGSFSGVIGTRGSFSGLPFPLFSCSVFEGCCVCLFFRFVSAAIGQLTKPFASTILYGKKFDFKTCLQSGGFPSTHSSSVVATATCLAMERGFSDALFGLAVIYDGLIMYDAQGVEKGGGSSCKSVEQSFAEHHIVFTILHK